MTMFNHKAMTAALALLLFGAPAMVRAEDVTVTTSTQVEKTRTEWSKQEQPIYKPGAHLIDMSGLDVNKDGILTKQEVGAALFKIFDTDQSHR